MSKALKRVVGFDHLPARTITVKHRPLAMVELITTAALALSTLIAVTAVSIGMARADAPGAAIDGGWDAFAVAALAGFVPLSIGVLVARLVGVRTQDA